MPSEIRKAGEILGWVASVRGNRDSREQSFFKSAAFGMMTDPPSWWPSLLGMKMGLPGMSQAYPGG